MKNNPDTILENAINDLRTNLPEEDDLQASARRVADRLGLDMAPLSLNSIAACEDVPNSLTAYRTGAIADARTLLIQAHLRECGVCQSYFNTGTKLSDVDWSAPRVRGAFAWRPRKAAWAMAPAFALLAMFFFLYRAFWQVPMGVRAEVQSIDGAAYRVADGRDLQLSPGDTLIDGNQLRTLGGSHAVLRLADGSTVELNERSVLRIEDRGKNTTIVLDSGAAIVQAAHRPAGHLYVATPDCRVAVTGTVFSVNAGIKGSRVAVLEGSLHVTHGGIDTLMRAGEQVSTNENLSPEPVGQQIAWSHDRDRYLLLMAQFDALQHRLDQISAPDLRYSSDLLQRVPANSLLYISIPNLGDFLSQANTIFNDQLQKSPALRQWWNSGAGRNTAELNTLIDKIHQVSQYLGDEIVIVGLKQARNPGFAVIADIKQVGLDTLLRSQWPVSGKTPPLVILNERSLAAASVSTDINSGGYALIRQREAVFSNSIAVLKEVNAQFNAGRSGFADKEFGQQILSAYNRGAGMILAADLQQMLPSTSSQNDDAVMENSGIRNVRYLIAEHREKNGQPENHLDVQFKGTRQGIASWLAAPAPIGSLDFLTPNASIAVAMLSKDPARIADDIMTMAVGKSEELQNKWTDAEAKLHIDLRNDLAANLGGDFLLSLDGPVLPTPAWKAVIEIHDADRMEKTLEGLVEASQKDDQPGTQAQGKPSHRVAIVPSGSGTQRFYSVQDVDSEVTIAQYTFVDGYMILAQDRAVLLEAMRAHATGDSLAHSEAFKALLPTDENANYSAVAYQNLSPALGPILSNVSGDLAVAIQRMAADARPTAICMWGNESTIEAGSNSHLLGFDLLAFQALIHPDHSLAGNKQHAVNVPD